MYVDTVQRIVGVRILIIGAIICVNRHITRTLQLGLNYVCSITRLIIIGGVNRLDYYENPFEYL